MSFLNPLTYVRRAAGGAKAIAGRSYYELEDGRLVTFTEDGVPVFGSERDCPDDDRNSQQAKGV